ncbi:MAG: hypothetical protein MJA30_25360 [Cytophagales bacterium]|nr:hypothetical protein [Cytophagales bacterium]
MKEILFTFFILFNLTFLYGQGPGNILQFDGINDYINLNTFTLVKDNPSHTIEMWVKSLSTETGAIYSEANLVSNFRGQFRLAGNGSGKLVLYYIPSASVLVNNIVSTTTVFDNTWHHIALVTNGNFTTLYVDGVADATNFNYNRPSSSEQTHSGIGAQVRCCFATGNFDRPFGGSIDEIRLWSINRSVTQIRTNMCQKLIGNEADLAVYYRLDQSSGTTVTDASTSTAVSGDLTHPNLTAPYASWQTSGAPIGDASVNSYSVTTSTSLNIASAAGDNFTANVSSITSTPPSIHVYRVDEPPNVSTPPGSQDQLSTSTYYGVKVFGGSGVTYTVILNYDGHEGITNENSLELAKRDDNATLTWSQESAVLNTTNKTLTLAGQTGTEYILASTSGNPLPIDFLSFEVELIQRRSVKLKWATASETNNDYFTIERSENSVDWKELARVRGAGNSSDPSYYEWVDRSQQNGTLYYRLKQTDFDGEYEYSELRSIEVSGPKIPVRVYPNPTKNKIVIEGDKLELEKIKIYNAIEQDITHHISVVESDATRIVLDLEKLDAGIFIIKTKNTVNKVYKQ